MRQRPALRDLPKLCDRKGFAAFKFDSAMREGVRRMVLNTQTAWKHESRVCGAVRRVSFGLALLGGAMAGTASAEVGLQPLRPEEGYVARIVSNMLQVDHLIHRAPDDVASERGLDLFLKQLDPMKLYFLQSDVAEFEKYRTKLDDMVRGGDVSAAHTIFKRFLDRVDERLATAKEILDQPVEFSVDEMVVIEPDATNYPADAAEARDRWRRQVKYSLLLLRDDQREAKEKAAESKPSSSNAALNDSIGVDEDPVAVLRSRYDRLAKRWRQTSNNELLELFLTSITTAYDPHTTYMSPSSLDNFRIMMRLNLEGIGAALREKDGLTVISDIIEGGAADKHGVLKEGDAIVAVGQGTEGPMVDTVDMKLDDVVKLIRGKAGSVVRLGVKQGGKGETQVLTITRSKVELEDSAARSKVITMPPAVEGQASTTPEPAADQAATGTTGETESGLKIGYINLPSFYQDMEAASAGARDFRSSTRDVAKLLKEFKESGIDALVLDLRINGGGSLSEAIRLTGLFIENGPVVQVKDSSGTIEPYADEDRGVAWDGPLVVLTSKLSASASEIFAGAIRDYRRGIVVGDETTHGKGTVQTLTDLAERMFPGVGNKNLGALKVTIQQFYLPDGESTQKEGVRSDVVLPSLTNYMDIGEADLDYALENDHIPPVPHKTYEQVNSEILNYVRTRSLERVKQSPEWNDLLRRIMVYRQQKDEKFAPLNEDRFIARRKELDAQQEEERRLLEEQTPADEIFPENFYNNEVLEIARDYVEALSRMNLASAG